LGREKFPIFLFPMQKTCERGIFLTREKSAMIHTFEALGQGLTLTGSEKEIALFQRGEEAGMWEFLLIP
jgi:hypothetical protein